MQVATAVNIKSQVVSFDVAWKCSLNSWHLLGIFKLFLFLSNGASEALIVGDRASLLHSIGWLHQFSSRNLCGSLLLDSYVVTTASGATVFLACNLSRVHVAASLIRRWSEAALILCRWCDNFTLSLFAATRDDLHGVLTHVRCCGHRLNILSSVRCSTALRTNYHSCGHLACMLALTVLIAALWLQTLILACLSSRKWTLDHFLPLWIGDGARLWPSLNVTILCGVHDLSNRWVCLWNLSDGRLSVRKYGCISILIDLTMMDFSALIVSVILLLLIFLEQDSRVLLMIDREVCLDPVHGL